MNSFTNHIKQFLRQYWAHISEGEATSLTFIFVLSLVVFCQMSWVPGFFHDGYLYAAFSKNAASRGFWLIPHLSTDTYDTFYQHSPFVFIMGGLFFKIFGDSVTAARLFGSLWGVGMVVGLSWFIFRFHDRWMGFLSGLILILSYPLVKKLRFPNMDLPLCFFMLTSLIFYIKAFTQRRNIFWILSGIFFGLALLAKGPPALALPLTFLIHLALTRRLKFLRSPYPWLSLMIGLSIFALWPITLYLNGQFEIFQKYYTNMFFTTALEGRGLQENDVFAYLKLLATETLPWFLAALWGLYKLWQRRDLQLMLWATFYICFLVIFSLMKFKYSHYILPLYAPQAVLAAYGLRDLYRKYFAYVFGVLRPVSIMATLALLIFPLTNHSSRDHEVMLTLERVQSLPTPPNAWAVVNDSYSFFGLANLLGYHTYDNAYAMDLTGLEAYLDQAPLESHVHHRKDIDLHDKRWLFILKKADWEKLDPNFQKRWLDKMRVYVEWKKLEVLVFLPREIVDNSASVL